MLKALFTFVLLFFVFDHIKAQNAVSDRDTLKFYLKNNGNITHKDVADLFLVITPHNVADKKGTYRVLGYYLNGKPKFTATSLVHSFDVELDGPKNNYYTNGNLESVMNYNRGSIVGKFTQYYPNGKLYAIKDYSDRLLCIECRDSTGNVLAKDGNGEWIEFDDNFKTIVRRTTVKKGIIGIWQPVIDTTGYKDYDKTGQVVSLVDVMPVYKEGVYAFEQFLRDNLIYPAIDDKNGISGMVRINMVVEKDGILTHFEIVDQPSATLGQEALRLVASTSPWQPGSISKGGPPVRVNISLNVNFALNTGRKKSAPASIYSSTSRYYKIDTLNNDTSNVYSNVTKQPEFPGGLEAFGQFLGNNIIFPRVDRDKGTSGKVILKFIVEKDGRLTNITAESGPSETLIAEAIKVMRLSPIWQPGILKGVIVRTWYSVPINFTISSEPSMPLNH